MIKYISSNKTDARIIAYEILSVLNLFLWSVFSQ